MLISTSLPFNHAKICISYYALLKIIFSVSDKEINKSLVDFLRQLPSKKLGVGLQMSTENDTFSASAYTPVLDGNFFPEPISELRKKLPKMLCMAGTCEYEALIFS